MAECGLIHRAYVVHGSHEVSALLSRVLELEGCEAHVFTSGEDLLRSLSQTPSPDLIIFSLTLPDIYPWRLVRLLRSSHFFHLRDVPVLMADTALLVEEKWPLAHEAGADDYVQLPTTDFEMQSAIRCLLAGRRHPLAGRGIVIAEDAAWLEPLGERLAEQRLVMERFDSVAEALATAPLSERDCLLIDASFMSQVQLPPATLVKSPQPTVILIADTPNPESVATWLAWGVQSVLPRSPASDDLREALRAARLENTLLLAQDSQKRQLEQLEAYRERLAMITDKAADMIWACDFDFHFTYVSPSVKLLTGYTAEEYLSLSPERMVSPASLTAASSMLAVELQQTNRADDPPMHSRALELDMYRKDGSTVTVEAQVRFLRDDTGKPVGIIGVSRDVSEQSRQRRELQELQAAAQRNASYNAALITAIPMPVFVKSADGRHISCNQAFTDFTGLSADQIRGKLPTELWPIELSNLYRWNDIAHLAGVAPGIYEHKMLHKSGELRDVLFAKDLFHDESGKVAGIVGAFMDLSEQKRSAAIIRRRSQYLEALTRGVLDLFADGEQMPYQPFVDHIGPVTGVSRVLVMCNSRDVDGRLLMHQHAEWCDSGTASQRDNPVLQGLAYEEFMPMLGKILQSGKVYKRQTVETEGIEREFLRSLDIHSLLATPVMVSGEFFGFIAFADCRGEHVWSEEDTFLQHHAAIILAQAQVRKRLERELLTERQLFLAGPVVVCRWLAREGWPLAYASPNIEKLTGFSASQLLSGQPVYADLIHSEDLERVSAEVAYYTNSDCNRFEHLPYRLQRRDGSVAWVLDTTDIIRGEDGVVREYVGYLVDMTSSRQMEEERDLLMQAIEQAEESVVIFTPEGLVQYANPAFCTGSGYNREHVLNRNIESLCCTGDDTNASHEMWRVIRMGRTWHGRMVNRRKDGGIYVEDAHVSPVKNDIGRIVSVVAVKREITRELELENQLAQARRIEALGRLASGIAHDFNNLLQVILGFNDLALMELAADHPARKAQLEVKAAGERATVLAKRIMNYSRLKVISKETIACNELIAHCIQMLQRAVGDNVSLSFTPSPAAGVIFADRGLLEQVLLNLCINARDAMPDGGTIDISTGNTEAEPELQAESAGTSPNRQVTILIHDTGYGMDAATLERIFDPYFTTKPEGKGSGLGLASVYRIVKEHGGHIDVHSVLGQGTSFLVCLPEASGEPAELRGQQKIADQGRGETVLLAEDNDKVRSLTQSLLNKAGYRVLAAGNGQEAVILFQQHADEVDVLCIDLFMPRMDGLQVWHSMRRVRPGVPVLFVSGSEEKMHQVQPSPGEPVFFVTKPYDGNTLLGVIRLALDSESNGARDSL